MRIFRYLFKEISVNVLAVASMLLLIFLSTRFVRYLGSAASGKFSDNAIFSLILFRLPSFLEIILPLSLFLGIMLGYGRLYVESEMVVLQTSGISKKRLLMYTQGPALLIMMMVASCTLYLTPAGYAKFEKVLIDPAMTNTFNVLIAGAFKKLGNNGMVIYTGGLNSDKTEMRDVFLVRTQTVDEKPETQIIKARSGQLVSKEGGQNYLELSDGILIDGRLGELDYKLSRYDTLGVLMSQKRDEALRKSRVEALPTASLISSENLKEQAALQWRLFMPFMVPIVAMIALALSETSHRKGRYFKLLPGILIFFLYLVMLGNARSQIEKAVLPASIALWIVHGGFFALALVLFNYAQIKHAALLKFAKLKASKA